MGTEAPVGFLYVAAYQADPKGTKGVCLCCLLQQQETPSCRPSTCLPATSLHSDISPQHTGNAQVLQDRGAQVRYARLLTLLSGHAPTTMLAYQPLKSSKIQEAEAGIRVM